MLRSERALAAAILAALAVEICLLWLLGRAVS